MSAETETLAVEPVEPPQKTRRVSRVVLGIVLIVLIAAGISWYLYSSGFENTDDAQVDGHLNPVASRIDGTIKAVRVDDNQTVQAGELLVELDPSDDQISLHQAQAQYDQAMAQLGAAHPNLQITRIGNTGDLTSQQAEVVGAEATFAAAQHDLDSAEAKLKESQAVNDRNQADFTRHQTLYDKQEVSRADYDQYKATATAQAQTVVSNQAAVASAQKTVEQRMAQLTEQRSKLKQTENSAPLQVAIREANIKSQQANAESAQAVLEQSRLNLSYGRLIAPVSGVITQRSAEVGARISKGQQLFMIVQTNDLWVTANFKETQLARIHPNQHVRIHVDALIADFDGIVESMPAVTGSRTSVLPPENATGNYVKVIQRLPVRIRFNSGQKDLDKLRPGMSVEPKVSLD
ncbi:HlyD family secretion protein [Tunturiibacter gelidiferens]|uniref:HlyD family secretion protein n=1 Tax=Tunturiibacter gelidiferens TaxID=3069689 RepID=A0AAU7YV73_9BACT